MEKHYDGIVEVLQALEAGDIQEGDILNNLDSGERIIFHKGKFRYLIAGDYLSNEVTLSKDTVTAVWAVYKPLTKEISTKTAFELVLGGKEVIVGDLDYITTTVNTFEGLLMAIEDEARSTENYLLSVKLHANADVLEENETSGRRTTETEAWAILLDRHLEGFSAEELSDKYGTSIRNIYYILDGTYYKNVHEKFFNVFEEEIN